MKVNTHIHKDNEVIATKLTQKRIWGKIVNDMLREMRKK